MIHLTPKSWWLVLVILSLSLSVCLTGCELFPQNPGQTATTLPDGPDQSGEPNADTVPGVLIHRIDIPLDVSLDPSWAEVDEQAVPVLMHGIWQVNGLRIGVLHAEHAQAFAETLPPIQGESRAKLYTSHYPTAIRSTPRLIDPVIVDLTVPPRSPTVYRARDGRLQLLVRIGRSEDGQAFLELTPHHHKPKTDLIPRSPLEKQLDGRMFHELSVMLPISPDTAVVVGLHRPWPVLEDEPIDTEETTDSVTPETTGPQPETGDVENTDSADPQSPPEVIEPPAIPEHLGRALIAGTRAGEDTQIMLVISMVEDVMPSSQSNDGR